jgi:hypothetical protein
MSPCEAPQGEVKRDNPVIRNCTSVFSARSFKRFVPMYAHHIHPVVT